MDNTHSDMLQKNETLSYSDMKRLEFIDIARGILIILVVFGHGIIAKIRSDCFFYQCLYEVIYSFHMPAFFILSGFLYAKRKEHYEQTNNWKNNFLKKKFYYLIIPYLTWSIFNYFIVNFGMKIPVVCNLLLKAGYSEKGLIEICYSIITLNGHMDSHIWFVYCLFMVFTVYVLFEKIFSKFSGLFVCVVLSALVSMLPPITIIRRVAFYLFYFSLGTHEKQINQCINSSGKASVIAIVTAFLLSCWAHVFIYTNTNISTIILGNVLGFWIKRFVNYTSAIFGTLLILKICLFDKRLLSESFSGSTAEIFRKIRRAILFVSSYSYDIYLIHNPILVNGVAYSLYFLGASLIVVICFSTFSGIGISIIASKFILQRSQFLSKYFLGKR